jgi:hypothetical protein
MSGFGFTRMFSEKWRKVLDGVLEGYYLGTLWFGVLAGYCRGNGDGHV